MCRKITNGEILKAFDKLGKLDWTVTMRYFKQKECICKGARLHPSSI